MAPIQSRTDPNFRISTVGMLVWPRPYLWSIKIPTLVGKEFGPFDCIKCSVRLLPQQDQGQNNKEKSCNQIHGQKHQNQMLEDWPVLIQDQSIYEEDRNRSRCDNHRSNAPECAFRESRVSEIPTDTMQTTEKDCKGRQKNRCKN